MSNMAFQRTTRSIQKLPFRQMSTQSLQSQTFTLPDGRKLGFAEYGDRNGTPLLYFHGYPSCRLEAFPIDEIAQRLKVRLIGLDRPGFGLSTPQPTRRILDWPTDVLAFAKGMQLSRFAVMGLSGGGPYALACAHSLPPENLIGVGLFASGPPWVAGAHQNSVYRRVMSAMASYWPTGLRIILDTIVRLSIWFLNSRPVARRIDLWLEQKDKEKKDADDRDAKQETAIQTTPAKTTAERRLELVHSLIEEPFAQGARAAVEEAKLLSANDWGFAFESVPYNPVRIWHGTEDKNAPVAMIRYMAKRIPHCVYHELEGDSHYTMFDHIEEAIAEITSGKKGE